MASLCLALIIVALLYYCNFTRNIVKELTLYKDNTAFMGENEVEQVYRKLAYSFPILALQMLCLAVIIG